MKRDRVIKALENCTDAEKCQDCPWAPCEEFDYPHSDYPDDLIKAALDLLKAEPKRGRWIGQEPHKKCSVCNMQATFDVAMRVCATTPFCPWCGSRMEDRGE